MRAPFLQIGVLFPSCFLIAFMIAHAQGSIEAGKKKSVLRLLINSLGTVLLHASKSRIGFVPKVSTWYSGLRVG